MTLNELTRAAAARLRALWPDRPVYVDDIPREADGCLYIGLIDSEQGQELDRRFKRSVSFQILYFRADQDALAYQDWAEALYDGFRTLEAGGRTVRLKNRSARKNGDADAGANDQRQGRIGETECLWEAAPLRCKTRSCPAAISTL